MECTINNTSEKNPELKSLGDFECLFFQKKEGDIVVSWEMNEKLRHFAQSRGSSGWGWMSIKFQDKNTLFSTWYDAMCNS